MKKILTALICLASFAVGLTSAYANHRTGTFALPELIKAGDFNKDGNLDLAVNVTGFDNIAIFNGDGQGGISLTGHISSDTLTKGLDVGDVDNDRRLDLVGCTAWGYDVLVHLGDGRSGFGDRDNVMNGDGEPTRLVVRDFNNDHRLDIVVNGPDEGVLLVYLGDGKGGFSLPPEEVEDLSHTFGLDAGDFNSDGNLDLVITTLESPNQTGTSDIHVLLGDGAGGFSESAVVATGDIPTSAKTGDLNNDGKLDVVAAGAQPGNTTGNFITTYLGNGNGGMTVKQTTSLGAGNLKGEIALGDFNEDGKLDVAFPKTGSQIQHDKSTSVLIFFGDGTGKLTAGPVLTVGEEPHTVIAVDMNKDGHLDLAVSNRTSGTLEVLLGSGNGNFTPSATKSVVSTDLDP